MSCSFMRVPPTWHKMPTVTCTPNSVSCQASSCTQTIHCLTSGNTLHQPQALIGLLAQGQLLTTSLMVHCKGMPLTQVVQQVLLLRVTFIMGSK